MPICAIWKISPDAVFQAISAICDCRRQYRLLPPVLRTLAGRIESTGVFVRRLGEEISMVSFFWLPAIACIGCVVGLLLGALFTQGKVNDLYKEVSELHQKINKRDELLDDMAATLKKIVLIFTDENYTSDQKLDMLLRTDKIISLKSAYFSMR
jgi:hypothetical protein